jgi:hypothetical protein
MMNGEAIGGLIISLLAFGAVIWVIRYFRERNSCPRCGDPSRPLVLLKYNKQLAIDDKQRLKESEWGDLVRCKACRHEWRRMPLDSGGGTGGFGGGSAG